MRKFRKIFVALFVVLTSLIVYSNTSVFAEGNEDNIAFKYYEQRVEENLYRLNADGIPSAQTFKSGVVVYHIEVPVSNNYTFRGWAYYVGGEQKILRAGDQFFEDTDFFALWTPTVRVVDYILDGGINHQDNPYYFFGTDDYTLLEPTKDKHVFLGWYNNPDFAGEAITYLGDKVKSMTLYAKWVRSSHEVIFDNDGVLTAVLVDDGNKVEKPEDPSKEGYLFAGWLLDGELFDFETPIVGDITLVAKWDIPLTIDSVETNAVNNLITGGLVIEVNASGTHLARMQVRVLLNDNKVVSLTLQANEANPIGEINEEYAYLYDLLSDVAYLDGKWNFTFDTTGLTNYKGDGLYDFEFRALAENSVHPESARVVKTIDVYNQLPVLVEVSKEDKDLGLVEYTISATGSKLHALRVDFAGIEWVEFYAAAEAWDPENWDNPEIWTEFIKAVVYEDGVWNILLDTKAYADGSYLLEFAAFDTNFVNESNKITDTLVIANEYEITYVTYDELVNDPSGFTPTITSYKSGVGLEELENPQNRLSSIFIGWYDNEDFSGTPITKIENTLKENITLYAKWELRVYDVVFVTLLGEDGEVIDTIEVPHAHVLGELPNAPVKAGYVFVAWKDSDDNQYDEDSIVLKNLDLYPQYVPTTAVVKTEAELIRALQDHYTTIIDLGANITLTADIVVNVGGFTLKTNEYLLNLDIYKITFGQTTTAVNYYIEGNFAGGTIILNNTNGHFELDGVSSETTNIEVIATSGSTAIIKGVWGDLLVEDISGHTILEATVNTLTTRTDTVIVLKDEAVIVDETESVLLGKVYYDEKLDHKVKFMDQEEELFEIEVPNGNKVTEPAKPTKDNHLFIGWYLGEELYNFETEVKEELTLVAKWETLRYKVTFNIDGELTEVVVDINGKVTEPETPTKEGHTFSSWLLDEVEYDFDLIVTGDIILVASWTVNSYTITYYIDGELYEVETYKYGQETMIYIPLKEGYTFKGWSPSPIDYEIMPAEDLVFTGSYERIYFKVTFVNENLEEEIDVEYHTPVEKPADPIKEGHKFLGWYLNEVKYDFDNEVTQAITLVAKWEINKYTIRFVNADGTVLQSEELEHGTLPSYLETPVKTSDAQYTYTFSGWTSVITEAIKDQDYTATYTETINKYLISFYDEAGINLLYSAEVEYGVLPTFDGDEPTKPATVQYEYTFAGWTPELVAVEAAQIYKAVFTASLVKYTVTFKGFNNVELKTQQVEYGNPAQAPDIPVVAGYEFTGWDVEFTFITEDLVVTAVYEEEQEELEEYLIYYNNFENGTENSYQRNAILNFGLENTIEWTVATESDKDSGINWNYLDTQDKNIGLSQGTNTARIHGKNLTTLTSDSISNVTRFEIDAKIYSSETASKLKIYARGDGDEEFVLIDELSLELLFKTFVIEIDKTNVQIRLEATGGRSNIDNIKIYGLDNGDNEVSVNKVTFDLGNSELVETFVYTGKVLEEPLYTPQKEGYTYTWFADSLMTEAYDFTEIISKDITIYLGWDELQKYTVTFDYNGDDNDTDDLIVYVYEGETVDKPTDPKREGYNFEGWKLGAIYFDFDITIEGSIILVADWEKIPENIKTLTITQSSFSDLGGSYDSGATKHAVVNSVNFEAHYAMKNGDNIQGQANNFNLYNINYIGIIKTIKITVTGSSANTLYAGDKFDSVNNVISGTFLNNTYVYSFEDNEYGYFKITKGASAIYISKIEIEYIEVELTD